IQAALYTFQGAKRRFEYIVRSEHKTYIDDYAHHPTEIKSLLETARSLYPNQKITIIFQPHLFTRTRDFAEDFATSLSLADQVILLDIYPARELPIEGVDSEMLLKKVSSPVKHHTQKENIIELLNSIDIDVLITAGAGDIDGLIPDIKSWMEATVLI
ncbi:MAG: glutamate ligase domain-containing protein, partial [Limisphaerales bacterium]